MIEIQLIQNKIEVEISKQPDIDIVLEKQGATGKGVPEGGTIGQVLTKKSDSDYDTEWKEQDDIVSKWENDEVDTIKPKDNKLVDYEYIKNKPDLEAYQKMSFDNIIGSFITTE